MYSLHILFIAVKRAITVRWHETEPPNHAEWLSFYGKYNGIRSKLKLKNDLKYWQNKN